ncbi:nucleolar protein 14-like [Schistocerca gregaria]|uniref:nucleolar protein 14-like n=1 Tax=Schistocerca gregaria TaxID=7010 RepID=UPI00211F1F65|nr:nucleolar protein 14-like [Schistocerca gregaria]
MPKLKDVKRSEPNPFEFYRVKHKQRLADGQGGVKAVRTDALQKRSEVIKREWTRRNKASVLVDRRLAEFDPSVSAEDKAFLRFQRTRQRQFSNPKGSIYNLDSEPVYLTHRGRRLDEIGYGSRRARAEGGRGEDGRDGGPPSSGFPQGSGGAPEGAAKTKAEVMQEVISRSKRSRHQAQLERESRLQLVEELDKAFPEMRELLGSSTTVFGSRRKALKSGEADDRVVPEADAVVAEKGGSSDEPSLRGSPVSTATREEASPSRGGDDYNAILKRLADPGIRRAHPVAPSRSEEQGEIERYRHLQQLEKERVARARGTLARDAANDVSFASFEPSDSNAGDLSDGDAREQRPSGGASSKTSSSEEPRENSQENRFPPALHPAPSNSPNRQKTTSLSESGEIPYVLHMPESFDEFMHLLGNQSCPRQAEIISRLRACYPLSLRPENRQVLERLYLFLQRRVLALGATLDRRAEKTPSGQLDDPNSLLRSAEVSAASLFELASLMPAFASVATKNMISEWEELHMRAIADYLSSKSDVGLVPSFSLILGFQTVISQWSTADQRHAALSPLSIHLGHVLSTLQLANVSHLLRALLLTNQFYQLLCSANQWASEPINLLLLVLERFLTLNANHQPPTKTNFLPLVRVSPSCLELSPPLHSARDHSAPASTPQNVDLRTPLTLSDLLPTLGEDDPATPNLLRFKALFLSLHLLKKYLYLHSSKPYSVEVLRRVALTLDHFTALPVPSDLRASVGGITRFCRQRIKHLESTRVPLRDFECKPVPLPTLTPDFSEEYFGKKAACDSRLKRRRLLQKKARLETRRTSRELRKETYCLQRHRMAEYLEKKAAQEEKYKETMKFLQEQTIYGSAKEKT